MRTSGEVDEAVRVRAVTAKASPAKRLQRVLHAAPGGPGRVVAEGLRTHIYRKDVFRSGDDNL